AFDQWLGLAFELEPGEWGELAALAPREVTVHAGTPEERFLALEFRPIVEEGHLARVMLLATDETEKLRLKRAGEEYARQMAAMKRLVSGGGQVFVSFLEGAQRRLARCEEILGAAPRDLRMGEIDELFQHVHTIKGEAQTFELIDLVAHSR